jgi:hypothetical protein
MSQTLAISEHLKTLAEVETTFGIRPNSDRSFFTEWSEGLPELSEEEIARLNLFKQRYLYHRKHGAIAEGAVNFIIMSPLLEMAGFYDPPYLLQSEVSVNIEVEDLDVIYRGRVDALVLQERLWVVLLESKRATFNFDMAIPQALSYMVSYVQGVDLGSLEEHRSVFGLVSNGGQFMFIKLMQQMGLQYSLSDEFSLYRQRNELCDVLKILKRLGEIES